jgi:hypothetical protein
VILATFEDESGWRGAPLAPSTVMRPLFSCSSLCDDGVPDEEIEEQSLHQDGAQHQLSEE